MTSTSGSRGFGVGAGMTFVVDDVFGTAAFGISCIGITYLGLGAKARCTTRRAIGGDIDDGITYLGVGAKATRTRGATCGDIDDDGRGRGRGCPDGLGRDEAEVAFAAATFVGVAFADFASATSAAAAASCPSALPSAIVLGPRTSGRASSLRGLQQQQAAPHKLSARDRGPA